MGQSIGQVLAKRTSELMSIEGVEGVGEGSCDGSPCIRVYVRDDAASRRLPRQLDGYVVDPVVTGVVRPRPDL